MYFNQIKDVGDNFSYIIADEESKETAIIDPSFNEKSIIQEVEKNRLKIKYIINTHHHIDHVRDNDKIKAISGAKIVAHKLSRINKDVEVVDGDTIKIGKIVIQVIHTPGHTPDGICLLFDKKVITGDTLFVGECGRTDMSGSNSRDMYNSLFNKLMNLKDDIQVYPGHDYGSHPYSTIGEEKLTNYTLKKRSLDEFIEFMKE